jgi:hypothetical protein
MMLAAKQISDAGCDVNDFTNLFAADYLLLLHNETCEVWPDLCQRVQRLQSKLRWEA